MLPFILILLFGLGLRLVADCGLLVGGLIFTAAIVGAFMDKD